MASLDAARRRRGSLQTCGERDAAKEGRRRRGIFSEVLHAAPAAPRRMKIGSGISQRLHARGAPERDPLCRRPGGARNKKGAWRSTPGEADGGIFVEVPHAALRCSSTQRTMKTEEFDLPINKAVLRGQRVTIIVHGRVEGISFDQVE